MSRASGAPAADVPANLVVEVRIVEARTVSPDYPTMNELGFFLATDGEGVSERQWLATIARNIPEGFLATLVATPARLDGRTAVVTLDKRARRFALEIDLGQFTATGAFASTLHGELRRGDEVERGFERGIELELGRTYVFSGPGLELTASEYVSHFRDYDDREQRAELYGRLRDYQSFLVVAVTLRDEPEPAAPPLKLTLPEGAELPPLDSSLGVDLVGTLELELELDANGAPTRVQVVRSSIPEVNPRILGAADEWRFPEAAGKTGRLVLELEAKR